jgi:hypothetical protein
MQNACLTIADMDWVDRRTDDPEAAEQVPSLRLGRRLLIPCRAFERWLDEAVGSPS